MILNKNMKRKKNTRDWATIYYNHHQEKDLKVLAEAWFNNRPLMKDLTRLNVAIKTDKQEQGRAVLRHPVIMTRCVHYLVQFYILYLVPSTTPRPRDQGSRDGLNRRLWWAGGVQWRIINWLRLLLLSAVILLSWNQDSSLLGRLNKTIEKLHFL